MIDRFDAENLVADRAEDVPQHSFAKSIALHLMPAVFVVAFYILAAPVVIRLGFPPGLSLLLGFLFLGIPIELGYLLYQGKKRNGTLSLRGIVIYRERIPTWQYIVLFLLLFAYAFSVLFLISPFTQFLAENVFSWLPTFLLPDGASLYPPSVPTAILVTLILGFIVDGVVNPIVEEAYFRGYLLPRISRFGSLAPLMNALLFSLQHYWQPYNVPLIFLIQLAVVYMVWWKRNIYISILTHCAGNLIGATLSLVGFLSS